MRILVTNDDGIDSQGLQILARSLRRLGDVVIGAPDTEYSGASAAVGALHVMKPEMHRAHVEGIDEAWAITGPPALCVLFANMGALGDPFDLVVSGINPGANIGGAVYHSGTVGAAITARNNGTNALAVSQAVERNASTLGQGYEEMLAMQKWHSAAEVATRVAGRLLDSPPDEAVALNLNVPNREVEDMLGLLTTEVDAPAMGSSSSLDIRPKLGHTEAFHLDIVWKGREEQELPGIETDVGAVLAGYGSLSWLGRVQSVAHATDALAPSALDELLRDRAGVAE